MRAPLAFGGVVGRDRVAQAQNAQGVAETGEAEADAALVAGFFALPFERPGGDVAQIANFCASPGFVSVSEKRSVLVSVEALPPVVRPTSLRLQTKGSRPQIPPCSHQIYVGSWAPISPRRGQFRQDVRYLTSAHRRSCSNEPCLPSPRKR